MEDFNSKYTGEQVEALLDIVSQGGSSGGGGGTITEADIANMGFTKNQGTITEVKMNGVSKGTSGVINLGDVPTKDVVDGLLDWQSGADEDIANLYSDKQNIITDLATIREGASKGATAVQSNDLMWIKADGEAGVRLKGTNGTATGNLAISAGDDKTASDGTAFASVASGDHAVAFGYGNTCAGRTTLAQGLYNVVNGKDAVAFGQRNLVNGDQAFAAGQQNEVTTRLGVTIGYQNKATNTNSIAIGYKNTSGGSGSVALGDSCESNGTSSTAMGYKTKAMSAYSSTFGENTQATNSGEVAMGSYNKSTTSTNASEQTAFSFGIGTSDTNRANALEIKKNGDVYIGDRLASEFITVEDVATVATTGSYNDLVDKPSIPSAVTESTVSGWGFTKNTGTYSKPSGGIPKSDLAASVQSALVDAETFRGKYTKPDAGIPKSDLDLSVQTSLGKADTSVQRDQLGEMKYIQIHGFEGTLSDNLYALPNESTGDEDDILLSKKSVKTINGESIFGSGNITIEGGGSSSGGGKEIVLKVGIYFDDADPVQPNKIYITSISSTSSFIEAFQEVSDYDEYCIIFKYPEYFYLLESVKFANGQIATIDYDTECELSVVGIGSGANRTYHAVLTPFKPVE